MGTHAAVSAAAAAELENSAISASNPPAQSPPFSQTRTTTHHQKKQQQPMSVATTAAAPDDITSSSTSLTAKMPASTAANAAHGGDVASFPATILHKRASNRKHVNEHRQRVRNEKVRLRVIIQQLQRDIVTERDQHLRLKESIANAERRQLQLLRQNQERESQEQERIEQQQQQQTAAEQSALRDHRRRQEEIAQRLLAHQHHQQQQELRRHEDQQQQHEQAQQRRRQLIEVLLNDASEHHQQQGDQQGNNNGSSSSNNQYYHHRGKDHHQDGNRHHGGRKWGTMRDADGDARALLLGNSLAAPTVPGALTSNDDWVSFIRASAVSASRGSSIVQGGSSSSSRSRHDSVLMRDFYRHTKDGLLGHPSLTEIFAESQQHLQPDELPPHVSPLLIQQHGQRNGFSRASSSSSSRLVSPPGNRESVATRRDVCRGVYNRRADMPRATQHTPIHNNPSSNTLPPNHHQENLENSQRHNITSPSHNRKSNDERHRQNDVQFVLTDSSSSTASTTSQSSSSRSMTQDALLSNITSAISRVSTPPFSRHVSDTSDSSGNILPILAAAHHDSAAPQDDTSRSPTQSPILRP